MRAFISWSSADPRGRSFAEIFTNWMSTVFVYCNDVRFFFSEEMAPGENGLARIDNELNNADIGFVLLTRRTARSPWVIYESGCLSPSFREGRVIPILFDLTFRELQEICAPLSSFQATSLGERDKVITLVERVAELAKLSEEEKAKAIKRADEQYGNLEKSMRDIIDRVSLLPDRYKGTIPYNENIGGATDFQIPAIFQHFHSQLFLVGINLNFLLNLRNTTTNFERLLDSLISQPDRQARILIADLWDEKIRYTYDKIVFGNAHHELKGLDEVFTNPSSNIHIDRFIQSYAKDHYDHICRHLTIKKISALMDTFWFIDPDNARKAGSMLLIPMTALVGAERPVFYMNQREHNTAFSSYFNVCKGAYDITQDVLWPPRST